jgi:uncharacterized membrane protein
MFLITAIVLTTAARHAVADMVPEDPYTDPRPSEAKPKPPPATVAPPAATTAGSPAATTMATAPAAMTRLAPPQTATADDTTIALGSVTFESGPLPSPFDTDPRLAGFRAGYVCEVVGVAGTYFDIADCRPAAIHGVAFDDASKPLVDAIKARYPAPSISFWEAQGWKLIASGVVLLAFAWIVWRLRIKASQRAARAKRTTLFHRSAIDPSVAANHMAAWERVPQQQPAAQPWQPAAQPWHMAAPQAPMVTAAAMLPAAQVQPPAYSAQPPATTCHRYGPYGRVTTPPRPMAVPYTLATVPHNPAAPLYNQVPPPSDQRYMPPADQDRSVSSVRPAPELRSDPPPSRAATVVDDFSKTTQDVNYQLYVERERAIRLARGSQPEQLEQTRRSLALQSRPVPEPPAIRATRLRHPPVPKPPYIAMLSHMPNRLS